MISLMEAAGRRPSVRRAGLLGSTPTKTMVGKPWICEQHINSQKQLRDHTGGNREPLVQEGHKGVISGCSTGHLNHASTFPGKRCSVLVWVGGYAGSHISVVSRTCS